MTRWGGALGRRRRGGRSSATTEREQVGQSPRQESAGEAVLVEDYESLFLVRSASDHMLSPADVADLARVQRSDDGTVTVIAGTASVVADDFWPRLSELLDSFVDSGTETVRLAMAHAGHDRADRPAAARRIADAWGLEVKAPDGPALVVPGGSLFVPTVPVGRAADGGWWRFAPGREPEPLGPRSPAPPWQSALRGLPAATDRGCVVEQIPAGLLVRPAEAAAARPGDLYHSVAVDPLRLSVVVGVPHGEEVSTEDIADVLSALPEPARSAVRLAPGGSRDLLRLAQSVSDRLDTELELMTGLPLVTAEGAIGTYPARSVVIGTDGTPRWLPFVDAVVCRPARGGDQPPPPRLLRWTTPLQGSARMEEGVVRLSEEWQVTVTRAGLWVGATGGPRLPHSDREVSAGGPVIEVGAPGERLDRTLWPALSDMLGALAADLRARVTLHVHGVPLDSGHELRRIAAHHGLRTIRFTPPPVTRAEGPGTGGRPNRSTEPAPPGASAVTAGRIPTGGSASPANPARAEVPGQSEGVVGRATASEGGVDPGQSEETGGRTTASEQDVDPGPGPAAAPSHSAGQGSVGPGPAGASEAAAGAAPAEGSVSPAGTGRAAGPETPPTPGSAEAGRPVVGSPAPRTALPESLSRADERLSLSASGSEPRAGSDPRARAPRTAAKGSARPPEEAAHTSVGSAQVPVGSARSPEGAADTLDGSPHTPEGSAQTPKRSAQTSDGPAHTPDVTPRKASETTPEPVADTGRGEDREGHESGKPALRHESSPGPAPDRRTGKRTAVSEEPAGGPTGTPGQIAVSVAAGPSTVPSGSDGASASAPAPERSGDAGSGSASESAGAPGSQRAAGTGSGLPSGSAGASGSQRAADPGSGSAPESAGVSGSERAAGPASAPAPAPDVPEPALPPVPIEPGHRSTEAERSDFRTLADAQWERHGAAVARSLARMPALRGKEQEAARADLIALRLYLHSTEGPLSQEALTRALRSSDERLLPYAACLGSALSRLPSYRGVVLRGTGADAGHGIAVPRPGTLLRDPAPVGATPLDPVRPAMTAGNSYVIWSVAARRVRQLLDTGDGPEEVVFAPGTLFRVLDVRGSDRGDSPVQIFLRELPGAHRTRTDPVADRAALERLDEAVSGRSAPALAEQWPERCIGPLGTGP